MLFKPAAALGPVKEAARVLNVALPAGFVTALDQAAALIVAAETLGDAGPAQLHSAVLSCLQRNGDPVSDKAVAKALTAHQLAGAGVGGAARDKAERDISAAMVEHADAMLTSFSGALQSHLDVLVGSAGDLPADLGSDSQTLIDAGGPTLQAWAACQESLRLTRAAVDAAVMLAMAAHVNVTKDRRILYVAPPDLDAFNDIRRNGDPLDVWHVARHSLPLRLIGSLGDLLERLADADMQRDAAARSHEQRQSRRTASA